MDVRFNNVNMDPHVICGSHMTSFFSVFLFFSSQLHLLLQCSQALRAALSAACNRAPFHVLPPSRCSTDGHGLIRPAAPKDGITRRQSSSSPMGSFRLAMAMAELELAHGALQPVGMVELELANGHGKAQALPCHRAPRS